MSWLLLGRNTILNTKFITAIEKNSNYLYLTCKTFSKDYDVKIIEFNTEQDADELFHNITKQLKIKK